MATIARAQHSRLENLQAQRSYLLNNLHQENVKATDLLRRLPCLQETLAQSQTSTIKRRARKQVGWLRYRINEITRQESIILNRLDQLAQEINSLERQHGIETNRRQHGSTLGFETALRYETQQFYMTPRPEYPFPYVSAQHQQVEGVNFPWRPSLHGQVTEKPSRISTPITQTHLPTLEAQLRESTPSELMRELRTSSMNKFDVIFQQAPHGFKKRHSIG